MDGCSVSINSGALATRLDGDIPQFAVPWKTATAQSRGINAAALVSCKMSEEEEEEK